MGQQYRTPKTIVIQTRQFFNELIYFFALLANGEEVLFFHVPTLQPAHRLLDFPFQFAARAVHAPFCPQQDIVVFKFYFCQTLRRPKRQDLAPLTAPGQLPKHRQGDGVQDGAFTRPGIPRNGK